MFDFYSHLVEEYFPEYTILQIVVRLIEFKLNVKNSIDSNFIFNSFLGFWILSDVVHYKFLLFTDSIIISINYDLNIIADFNNDSSVTFKLFFNSIKRKIMCG